MKKWISFNEHFYAVLGFVFFFFFMVLSIIFYKQTTISYDYSFELANIINGDGMLTFRWGAAPWRFFAFIGPTISLPLKSIILLTSIFFIFLKFCIWYLCQYTLKNTGAGVMVIVTTIAGITDGFYAQGWQGYNAIVYFCLFFAILTNHNILAGAKGKWVKFSLLLLLAVLVKNTYVVIFILCLMLIILELLHKKFSISYIMLFALLLTYFVTSLFHLDSHESNVYSNLFAALKTNGFFHLKGAIIFYTKKLVSLDYSIPLVLFLTLLLTLIKNKAYFDVFILTGFLSTLVFVSFYAISIHLKGYPYLRVADYYIESTFYTLITFQITMFIYYSNKHPSYYNRNMFKCSLLVVIIFYTSKITNAGIERYEQDLYINALMDSLRNDFRQRIFIINEDLFPDRFARLNFALPYESVLKSSINQQESISLYATTDTNSYTLNGVAPVFINRILYLDLPPLNLNDPKSYFTPFHPYTFYKKYHPQYFHFKNYEYVVLGKDYIRNFNKKYGLPRPEY